MTADRRPTRRLNPRIREPVGRGARERPQRDSELGRLVESGDTSTATMERMAELLGQFEGEWPPDRDDAR